MRPVLYKAKYIITKIIDAPARYIMLLPSIVLLWFNFLLNKHVDYIICSLVSKDYTEFYFIYVKDQYL